MKTTILLMFLCSAAIPCSRATYQDEWRLELVGASDLPAGDWVRECFAVPWRQGLQLRCGSHILIFDKPVEQQ